jgi:hypothetical protein
VKKKERNLKKKEKAKRTKTLLVDFLSLLVTVNFTTNIGRKRRKHYSRSTRSWPSMSGDGGT